MLNCDPPGRSVLQTVESTGDGRTASRRRLDRLVSPVKSISATRTVTQCHSVAAMSLCRWPWGRSAIATISPSAPHRYVPPLRGLLQGAAAPAGGFAANRSGQRLSLQGRGRAFDLRAGATASPHQPDSHLEASFRSVPADFYVRTPTGHRNTHCGSSLRKPRPPDERLRTCR